MTATPVVRHSAQTPTGKIRVLVVDDSLVIRHLVRQALSEEPSIEVVGAEANGALALARIPELKPDILTLDIEMPVMDGLETLRQVRKRYPRLRTIMFSTLTTRGASVTLEALALGADDYVGKAANAGSLDKSLVSLRGELVPKICQFFLKPQTAAVARPVSPSAGALRQRLSQKPQIVVIGVSTGGPTALAETIPKLPGDFPVPVLVVQHMPAMFTRLLAERLQTASGLRVREAAEGDEVLPGTVLVAPGDYHMRVAARGGKVFIALDQSPPENSCRPSADVLFRSVAQHYRGKVLSVVLTGMGCDGLRGVRELKAAGASTIVQDMTTSVVWGMPGAVATAGLADQILPLSQIAPEIIRLGGA